MFGAELSALRGFWRHKSPVQAEGSHRVSRTFLLQISPVRGLRTAVKACKISGLESYGVIDAPADGVPLLIRHDRLRGAA